MVVVVFGAAFLPVFSFVDFFFLALPVSVAVVDDSDEDVGVVGCCGW